MQQFSDQRMGDHELDSERTNRHGILHSQPERPSTVLTVAPSSANGLGRGRNELPTMTTASLGTHSGAALFSAAKRVSAPTIQPEALAHDARNLLTALGLYCDLLEEPGVLGQPFRHYSDELRLVATACGQMVEKLASLDSATDSATDFATDFAADSVADSTSAAAQSIFTAPASHRSRRLDIMPNSMPNSMKDHWSNLIPEPIHALAAHLRANRNILSAMAGSAIRVELETMGGENPVRLTGEELTRVLVNLVKNASEAMPRGGQIDVRLSEVPACTASAQGTSEAKALRLTISDNGPGIPSELLEAVFDTGFTTRIESDPDASWPGQHRGLGLSITRSIIEAAGGAICARRNPAGGTCFEIELPVDLPSWTSDQRHGPKATARRATEFGSRPQNHS